MKLRIFLPASERLDASERIHWMLFDCCYYCGHAGHLDVLHDYHALLCLTEKNFA